MLGLEVCATLRKTAPAELVEHRAINGRRGARPKQWGGQALERDEPPGNLQRPVDLRVARTDHGLCNRGGDRAAHLRTGADAGQTATEFHGTGRRGQREKSKARARAETFVFRLLPGSHG